MKQAPYIVAEISANHLGSRQNALELISIAANAGADAVKFQTYTPASMVCNPDEPITEGTWKGRKMGELYAEAMTPYEWHADLFRFAAKHGLDAFSSVFDETGLQLLERLACPCYKIASFELTDIPLIRMVAATKKPMIMSTGMATADEVYDAVSAIRQVNPDAHITLLKCTSGYPAPIDEVNLVAMKAMLMGFGVNAVGFSDHTQGIGAAVAAATLGATMIEKHLCLARNKGGPDAAFSLEPLEFAAMVTACRQAVRALGEPRFLPTDSEMPHRNLRRSLYWASSWLPGKMLEREMMRTARPEKGLSPAKLPELLGRRLVRNVRLHDPVLESDFEPVDSSGILAAG